MRQTMHLLILDSQRRCALAAWCSGRWLLPVVDLDGSVRAAFAIRMWLAARNLPGDAIGQWCGRVAANGTVDWLAVACLRGTTRLSDGLAWTRLETLVSAPCALDYQGWALTVSTSAGRTPSTDGPFGHTSWLEEATRFVCRVVSRSSCDAVVVPHRISPAEVVLECQFEAARYFLKGLIRDRINEARLTATAHSFAPNSFARTLALETRQDHSAWWLAEACPGSPLAQDLSPRRAAAVAGAYARVQQLVATSDAMTSMLTPLNLGTLVKWAAGILDGVEAPVEHCRSSIQQACDYVQSGTEPRSWIAADLDPSNVIVSGDEVRFIDLDDAWYGPAQIGMAVFVRRLRRIAPLCADVAREAYAEARPYTRVSAQSWRSFYLVSELLECHLGWQRLLSKMATGEVSGLGVLPRQVLAARLVRACLAAGRS